MLTIAACDLDAAEPRLAKYCSGLVKRGAPIEAYLEERLLKSRHFSLMLGAQAVGLYSIEDESLLTHFEVDAEHGREVPDAFRAAMHTQNVREALVATFDESFLSLALDHQRSVKTQAYLFRDGGVDVGPRLPKLALSQATPADSALVLALSGDFFDNLEARCRAGQLYLARLEGVVVGFGIVEPGRLAVGCVAIGMFVVPEWRNRGVGSSILVTLKGLSRTGQARVVAGCWYYNHGSRRALQNAGLWACSRLLRVQL